MSPEIAWLGGGVALFSFSIGALVRRYAGVLRLIDVPNERSSHSTLTPRGGGLGIVMATVLGLASARLLDIALPAAAFLVLIGGGVMVAVVSLIDDLRGVRPPIRLGVHFAAGGMVLVFGGVLFAVDVPSIGHLYLGWVGVPLILLWVAGMANAFNFMDGVDGLAGSQAVIAAGTWAVAGWYLERGDLMTIGVLLAAASAGFLIHNWSPARLFMGDVGSAFLGYSLAAVPLLADAPRAPLAFSGVVVLWPFVFDPAYTLIRRASRGENLFLAHRSHLYQRLVAAGWRHQSVCLLYVLIAFAGSIIGIAILRNVTGAAVLSVIYLPGSILLVTGLVRTYEGRLRSAH